MSGPPSALLERAKNGDTEACEQLVHENQGLIWSVVRRFFGRGVETDDLYQLGSLGFVKAVQGFDTQYGTAFSTYAVPKISGEIRRFMRDDGMIKVSRTVKEMAYKIAKAKEELSHRLGREPVLSEIAGETGFSPEEIAMCETALQEIDSLQRGIGEDETPLERLVSHSGESEEKILEQVVLKDAIERLDEREKKVILLRYFRAMTQEKAAGILGVSQVQVSRIERKAIDKIRGFLDE